MKPEELATPDISPGNFRGSPVLRTFVNVTNQAVKSAAYTGIACILASEIVILLTGVIARYVFSRPLPWSDELAAEIFQWLVMLGAVVAVQREEHMRIFLLARGMSDSQREIMRALGTLCVFAISLVASYYSILYTLHELPVSTYSLQISRAWRISALPVGFALMAFLASMQLLTHKLRHLIGICAFLCALWISLGLISPILADIGNYNLLFFFVVLIFVGVFAGIPIAFVFLIATLLYLTFMTRVPLTVVVGRVDEGMASLILLSVPLFVFLGRLMEETGLARSIMHFLILLLGHLRGGLSYVLLAAMFIVSGISGSKMADMAAVAPVLFPDMKKRGSTPGSLVALLAASGAMTETIPPGLVLITTGVITGVSIQALFSAGIFPAILLTVILCVVIFFQSRHERVEPVRAKWKALGKALVIALPAILLPVIIRGAVVEGVATATEVSTIGIAYACIAGVTIYRPFPWAKLSSMMVDTASLSGAILLIIGAATAMAWALTQSGFAQDAANAIKALPGGPVTFIAASIVVFICLGSLLEGIPAMVVFAPLVFPIARSLGFHDVHYAIVLVLSLGIGLFIPPFGIGYWAACAIGKADPDEGVRPLLPLMLALLVGLAIIAAVPQLSIGFTDASGK